MFRKACSVTTAIAGRCHVVSRRHVATSPPIQAPNAHLRSMVIGGGLSIALAWWYVRRNPVALESEDRSSFNLIAGDANQGESRQSRGARAYISPKEVAQHCLSQDAWIIINGKVYDVTHFHEYHPGGAAVIVSKAGSDASEIFNSLHPPGTIENNLPAEAFKGYIDPESAAKSAAAQKAEKQREKAAREALPPVETILGLDEFEVSQIAAVSALSGASGEDNAYYVVTKEQEAATSVMNSQSAEYYRGGALDGISKDDNKNSFKRCRIVPRVMRDVSTIAPQTTIFGLPSALPLYISPASNAILGHPDGELNLTRAAAKTGIVQGVSYVASYPLSDILEEKAKEDKASGSPLGMVYQVYVRPDRSKTEELIRTAIDGGCRALLVTVDSNIGDFRQSVEKLKGTTGSAEPGRKMEPFRTFAPPHDPSLNWKDIAWLKEVADGVPIYLKGVSSVEDVRLARDYGVQGCILSNHGGRQLDRARAGFDSLRRINEQDPELLKQVEVYVDGGARRGADVLMALALGARGVGLGRPFLFAQAAYGEVGAIRAVRILESEIVTAMQLMGVSKLDQLRPEMVECLQEFWR